MRVAQVMRCMLALLMFTHICYGQTNDAESQQFVDPSEDSVKTVFLSVIVLNLPKVDAAEEGFFVNLYYRTRWYDPSYAHLKDTLIVRPISQVWHPEIQLVNQKRIFPMLPEQVVITTGGMVVYRQRIYGELAQGLELRDFPFDTHTFHVQFGSPGLLAGKIRYVPDPMLPSNISKDITLSDWDILKHELTTDSVEVAPGLKVVGATFGVKAQRRTGYFVINIIIPLAMIVMMSWSIFWLKTDETGTRVTVAITAMLTIIAYRFVVTSLLPQISYLTRMDFFVLACSVMVFLALSVVMLTRLKFMRGKEKQADWVSRILFPAAFLVILLVFIF